MILALKKLIEAAEEECLSAGCTTYSHGMGGKHFKFRIKRLDKSRLVTISSSPSCPFVEKKVRRNVRHVLKELGYEA